MQGNLNSDPRLPALPLAFDFDAVAQLFKQSWLEDLGAPCLPVAIHVGQLLNTQYQPSVGCVTTYTLWVEQPGADPRQTIGVLEIGPSLTNPRLFDADPQMPWLRLATDCTGMGQRFAGLWDGAASVGAIECLAITPVRYKPGERCTLRYEVRTPEGRRTFFGKTLAQDGDRLAATLTALYLAGQAAPEMPCVLRPVAYWPEVHLVVQPTVAGGIEFHALVFDPNEESAVRVQWMQKAGASLAALHASVRARGPQRELEDDRRELCAYCAPVAQFNAPLATKFERTVGEIAAMARGRAEPAPVASHGAFRTDHLLLGEDGHLVLIDLDSYCWANPARDVGNFLAYLNWRAIRQPEQADFVRRAQQAFLNGYVALRPSLDADWVALYQAASMLKIVGRRYRSLTVREWPLTSQLFDIALSTLSDGLGGAGFRRQWTS